MVDCILVLVKNLEEDSKRGHDGSRNKALKWGLAGPDEGEVLELPRVDALDDGLHVLQVSPKYRVILFEVAEEDEDQRIRSAVDERSDEVEFRRLRGLEKESFSFGFDLA